MQSHQVKRAAPVVLACIGLLGFIVYANIPDNNGVIYGCYKMSGGLLRVVDYPNESCDNRAEILISWNQTGPQGPQGEAGPSNAYYTAEHGQISLPNNFSPRTIAALRDLPSGSYLLTAHTTAVNSSFNLAPVRCGIRAAGQDSFGTWGSATAVGFGESKSWFAQAFVSLPVTSDQVFDAEFYCLDSLATSTAYVEESRLSGIRVGSMEVRPNAVP